MKTKFKGFLTLLVAFVVQITFAQEKTVSGTVVDESNMPLPTATVLIKGTTTGTSTDFDGKYSIKAKKGDVLVFSYVGYKNQSVTVGESNSINVKLVPDNQLDAVIVTAMGIKRKADEITTANQVVKTEELTQANNPDIVAGLSGKVSGLQINTINNGVNGDTKITLRGNRSITGDNSALIVIDGIISNAAQLKALNPDTIESVNVIKGANGAALYGSQGANGAMIVTTKTGSSNKDGKLSISVKSTVDFEDLTFVPERQTRYGQGWDLGNGFENITYENGGWGAEFDGAIVPVGLPQADGSYIMAPYATRGKGNIKDFFEYGSTFQNSVTLSAGDKDGYFNAGIKRTDAEFVIPGDKLSRISVDAKAGKKINKWHLGANVNYATTQTNEADTGLYNELLQTASNIPIQEFENSGNEGHWNGYFFNPYWLRDNNRNTGTSQRANVGGSVQYDINDNINVVVRPNVRLALGHTLNHQAAYSDPASVTAITGYQRSQQSVFFDSNSTFKSFTTDVLFNFDYNLTEDITFKANVGSSVRNNDFTRTFVRVTDLVIPELYIASNGTIDAANTNRNSSKTRYFGVFGQADFGYKDYLFLNVTGRNDWASTLNKANNSFFYPSVGLSFIPTKAFEDFGGDWLDYAKLSASYVKVGSDGFIGAYDTFPTMNSATGYPFNGVSSFIANQTVTDKFLTPEFTSSIEVGGNFEFLKRRITLDVAYYKSNTTDQVVRTTPSSTSGLASNRVNLAETETTGYEVDLGLTPFKSDNFQWDLNLSYATDETIVTKVSDETNEVALGGFTGLAQVFAVEGERFPLIKGTAYARDPQGRVLIDPTSGNPIQATGLKILGQSTPDYIVGLNSSVRFKNFKLAATLDYRTGHVFYSDTKANLAWSGHLVESAQGGRGAFIFPNSAIETSPGVFVANTNVPTGGTTAGSFITYYNSYRNIAENNVLDATAVKLREVSLSYTLPDNMLKNTPIQSLSIGVSGRNLLTVLPAENRGYGDPEFGFSSGNSIGIQTTGQYPPTRSFGFNVNLTF